MKLIEQTVKEPKVESGKPLSEQLFDRKLLV
jgi:hypothetical protein